MANTFKKLLTLTALPFLLVGCAQEFSFKEWKVKAEAAIEKAAEKEIEVDYIKAKGNYDGDEYNFTTEDAGDMSVKEMLIYSTVLLPQLSISVHTSYEKEDTKYYAGNGFKIEHEDWSYTYNDYGLLTKVVTDDYSFTVSYVYVK